MSQTRAKAFLKRALNLVESESIREWATSDHNYPHWVKFTSKWLESHHSFNNEGAVLRLATCITLEAMG